MSLTLAVISLLLKGEGRELRIYWHNVSRIFCKEVFQARMRINRTDVARVVLQTLLSLIHKLVFFLKHIKTLTSINHQSWEAQTCAIRVHCNQPPQSSLPVVSAVSEPCTGPGWKCGPVHWVCAGDGSNVTICQTSVSDAFALFVLQLSYFVAKCMLCSFLYY